MSSPTPSSAVSSSAITEQPPPLSSSSNPDINTAAITEQSLREELHKFRKKISKREPLDPTYFFLLLKNYVKPPKITKDKLYEQFDTNLRENVEYYMNKYGTETPTNDARKWTIGRHRQNLNESKMRDAFTIRECKEHEQHDLIHASLLASNARFRPGSLVNEGERKRKIQAMAEGLLEGDRKKKQREKDRQFIHAAKQKMLLDYEKKQLEYQRENANDVEEAKKINEQLKLAEKQSMDVKLREEEESERMKVIELNKIREQEREKERIAAEKRERERIRKEREDAARRARQMETPQQALHRLYEPIFISLWDMEFWDGCNPFRMVIDRSNCAAMGAPDYCDVIEKPMNLTYIRDKVDNKEYMTLQAFFGDVELLINNALLYNSDENNPYHVAAIKMKNKYIELRKKLMLQIDASKAS